MAAQTSLHFVKVLDAASRMGSSTGYTLRAHLSLAPLPLLLRPDLPPLSFPPPFARPAGIQVVLYFIFGNNMIALAFLLSCFFSSSKTATVFAYLVVFGTGLIGSLLLSQLINAGQWYTTLLQLIPSFALFRCVG